MALLEARPYRPFKSSEEYLEAMKEDLAEWLSTLYPELLINAENFMDRLDTGVALCKHANYVRQAAEDYLARRQARNKSMTRSMTSGLAGPILALGNVHYLPAAKSGTFFSRDNVSNFITWCRKSLKIIECLLFETDDLIMRKNEKHVILCLLEVARRGAKFGMLAPMLVQMERQIDREIAADNKANGIGCGTQTDVGGIGGIGNGIGTGGSCVVGNSITQTEIGVGTENIGTGTDMFDTDSENEDEDDEGPMLMYGPQPQIITNDLKSLDEMVRDLVEKCTCPSQFPMVRVSEGKYRIGDTKVLIFVRILRSHVMVRVGGGWDTLSHYLDKHDPCRCKAQHRSSVAARLIPRTSNQTNGIELHRAQVIFERSPPTARRIITNFNSNQQVTTTPNTNNTNSNNINNTTPTPTTTTNNNNNLTTPSSAAANKNRSRSPTPQRKYLNQLNAAGNAVNGLNEQQHQQQQQQQQLNSNTVSNNEKQQLLTSPNLTRRSMSPSPRRLIDMRKKQTSLDSYNSGPKSLPIVSGGGGGGGGSVGNHVQFDSLNMITNECNNTSITTTTTATTQAVSAATTAAEVNNTNKFENVSDNGSEISDEGYRSLGVIQSNAQKRESIHSQASMDDAESNARLDQTSSDSQLSPVDDATTMTKLPQMLEIDFNPHTTTIPTTTLTMEQHLIDEAGPQSLPAVLTPMPTMMPAYDNNSKFEQSGVYITDDDITVDIASNTGLRKTGFSNKIFGTDTKTKDNKSLSKIPRSPNAERRRRSSIDNSTCATGGGGGSLQDLSTRTGLPIFNRKKPVYRSVRRPTHIEQQQPQQQQTVVDAPVPPPRTKTQLPAVRDVTNTWSGRTSLNGGKKRPTINADTFSQTATTTTTTTATPFERSNKQRSSQILYDSNGRRIRGCTASLTTSPVKNHAASPLAQQLLEAASSAKNDAQILEKMKALLSSYASSNQSPPTQAAIGAKCNKKTPSVYEDFTTAWVHSNGNLERSNSCSPPTKQLSKRSSAASSCESTHSRDMSVIVSPRRERGLSKIPAPVVRQHTELY